MLKNICALGSEKIYLSLCCLFIIMCQRLICTTLKHFLLCINYHPHILIYNKAVPSLLMLFSCVEVGNRCLLRNANAEGSCQALICVEGVH